ncbi:hypothetical protein JW933_10210 [candidate division FCPU426 bacterium]|nr:hypothetical protein [candidate division FCPU426 bacterium]
MFLRRPARTLLFILLCSLPVTAWPATASLNVDVLSLTLPARALSDLQMLPPLDWDAGLMHMPFYFQIHFSGTENLNWALELFSNNQRVLGAASTPDGLLRGLRGVSTTAESIPLYWQAYDIDQNVAATWGTPNSVTSTVGGLGIYPNTLHYWGTVYDRADIDQSSTWDSDRARRFIAAAGGMGAFPQTGRTNAASPVYLYIGGDLRSITNFRQAYSGLLTLQLLSYPFDFNRGCFATPNPVKPALGQRVFFNFYTNHPDSAVNIKVFDPTGFPVRTVKNARHWDCRNDRGHLVEGGLYLYQIEVEGHVISGTVVVIK